MSRPARTSVAALVLAAATLLRSARMAAPDLGGDGGRARLPHLPHRGRPLPEADRRSVGADAHDPGAAEPDRLGLPRQRRDPRGAGRAAPAGRGVDLRRRSRRARTASARFPPPVARVRGEPEEILALQPDLVFVTNFTDEGTVRLLDGAGIPLVRFAGWDSFAGVLAARPSHRRRGRRGGARRAAGQRRSSAAWPPSTRACAAAPDRACFTTSRPATRAAPAR